MTCEIILLKEIYIRIDILAAWYISSWIYFYPKNALWRMFLWPHCMFLFSFIFFFWLRKIWRHSYTKVELLGDLNIHTIWALNSSLSLLLQICIYTHKNTQWWLLFCRREIKNTISKVSKSLTLSPLKWYMMTTKIYLKFNIDHLGVHNLDFWDTVWLTWLISSCTASISQNKAI